MFENDSTFFDGFTLRVMSLATKTITLLGVNGQRPRWSPSGDLIAYFDGGRTWVVRPDGTGAQAISPAGRVYVPGVQWSPDGIWVLARISVPSIGGTTVALLGVTSGDEIPLPYTTGYQSYGLPAWKPGS